MKIPRTVRRLAAIALAAVVSACSVINPQPQPPCPPVLVLKDASEMVRFRPGPGRDVTDVLFSASIVNFLATCAYNRKRTEVDINLFVDFVVVRGPADQTRKAAFDYFVAIPHFHPAPQGKRVLPTGVQFEGNQTRLRYRDRVELTIPLDPKRPRSEYSVYIGFQLTPEEIEANRKRRGG